MKRWPEWALLFAGVCFICVGAWRLGRYETFQKHPDWFANSLPVRPPDSAHLVSAKQGNLLGRLEIRRIGLSVLVVEGGDEGSLGVAAGHLPETAAIGGAGNAVIVGHRDVTFRPLRRVRVGDTIAVHADRTYEYVVQQIRIVNPEDIAVLRGRNDQRTLTLITCYPFRYLGSAPKRYVVSAKLSGLRFEAGESWRTSSYR